ncbi:MAG: beta-Ala-His dipeptidase, partial [Bacteroidales bacterium]|nr:beta-Ala-His dipeptidase [Bacteroidales bacterium]
PITPRIVEKDGQQWVYASGTTLGADNGLGVATAMAILEAKDLQHGPIEALFTVDEETGMTGAFKLAPGVLKGDILINMDSETEGELYVGCAGGLDVSVTKKYKEEPVPAGYVAYEITVKGLRGGHSGMEINEGRGNANKVMARVLLPLLRDHKGKLSCIQGGNLRNAIPRECVAVIAVPQAEAAEVEAAAASVLAEVRNEFGKIDPAVEIFAKKTKAKTVIAGNVGLKMIMAVSACTNEVTRMSLDMPGMVETSGNLAIVRTENGVFTVSSLIRSSIDSSKMDMAEQMRNVFELAGAKVKFSGGYSGWKPNMDSVILAEMKRVYKKLYGNEPKVLAVHAGLECGILGAKYPNWDMVSCGPTLCSPHSPDERVFVPSVAKFWDFIVEVLKEVPKK